MNVGWLQALGMQFLHMQYFSQPIAFCSRYPFVPVSTQLQENLKGNE
jgi:hypothetical protein